MKISTTKEEYLQVVDDLKQNSPPPAKPGEKRTKTDAAHIALLKTLEDRLEAIDAELQVSTVLVFVGHLDVHHMEFVHSAS